MNNRLGQLHWVAVLWGLVLFQAAFAERAGQLQAGAAKVDITSEQAGDVDGRLHVRALVLRNDSNAAVIITVDAVAIGQIGYIGNDYLTNVRQRIQQELGIEPAHVLVNASHCHGIVCEDVQQRTVQAVKQAASHLVPVRIGAGVGQEDRIMENRRLKLSSGREVDVRHAYSLPPDDQVVAVGPVDPEIGVLRLDRQNGSTLAVVYNFACHPIQGVPSEANTADITGFSSEVIEDNLSEPAGNETDKTVALFMQGCAGDINPIYYKAVSQPRSAEPLGNMLGLSTLKAVREITTKPDPRLKVLSEVIQLPRSDLGQRIIAMKAERDQLVQSLQGTFLNLETFLPLVVKYKLSGEFPSYNAYGYLHQQQMDRDDLNKLDAANRAKIKQYVKNVQTMEQVTRINTNLRLLEKHQTQMLESGKRTIDAEVTGLRVGEFVLTTFPGELTAQIGINIKQHSPHELTFVAGYTNGYLYYAPTAEQLRNAGGAQEDSDCLLAPEWQQLYESKVAELLGKL